jgi:hypothetical protein
MSIFKAVGTQTAAAKTILTIVSTAAVRPRLLAAVYSQVGAVVLDSNWQVQGKRFTAAGTAGSAVTPAPTDPNDPAATFTAGSNLSAEPTYTANTTFTDMGINPRNTFRWVAYDPRDEIILPATAANGIGFLLNALGGAITAQVEATVLQ